ncbi:MAG: S-layer homology domain-containing protein [Armatimonadetes bacterium]|nr:S-layer homology domain-containing protein [Armatimonadota bacterium]
MNKTLKLALSAVLGMTLAAPAFAQNFPDVPENHWAYTAVGNLKDKIVFGYPDGFYRGPRVMTRYEFAVAVDKLWKAMQGMFDSTQEQIDALKAGSGSGDNGDIAAMKRQIAALESSVNGMKGWGTAISDLQKLTKEFEKDLAALDVDVEGMKKDMSDMKADIEELMKRSNPVKLGADVDLLVLAGHSIDHEFGILPDGLIVGEGRDDYAGVPVGMTRDLSVLHQAAFNFSGGKEGEPKWNGTLVVGNVLNSVGDYSSRYQNTTTVEGDTDVYFRTFSVSFDSGFLGQDTSVELGRIGHQVGPYIWKRTSFTKDYFKNEARDSGDWIFDGGKLDFNFGAAALTVFGGRNSDRYTTNGLDMNPSTLYQGSGGRLDQTLGAQLNVPIGDTGDITLAYLWQDSDDVQNIGFGNFNRRNVFGAQAHLMFGGVSFWGSYAQTVMSMNTSTALDDDSAAWDVRLGFNAGPADIKVGYRRVEGNFSADGDWGRVGLVYNPKNVEGFNGKVAFNASNDVKVWAKGEFLQGATNGAGGYFMENDDVVSYAVGVKTRLSNMFDLNISYEDTKFDFNAGTDPSMRWLTFGLGYNLSENANLMFTYIYSDVDTKGRTFENISGRYKGGLLGTQLSIKY